MNKIVTLILMAGGLVAGAETVNLVGDGNFSKEMQYWRATPKRVGEVVPGGGPDGQNCYRLSGVLPFVYYCYERGDGAGNGLALTANRTYTVSAWIKYEKLNPERLFGKGLLYVINYGWRGGVTLPINSGEEGSWRRYSMTFRAPPQKMAVPAGKNGYSLLLMWPREQEGTVWITDIQLEEGDQMTPFVSGMAKTETTAK